MSVIVAEELFDKLIQAGEEFPKKVMLSGNITVLLERQRWLDGGIYGSHNYYMSLLSPSRERGSTYHFNLHPGHVVEAWNLAKEELFGSMVTSIESLQED